MAPTDPYITDLAIPSDGIDPRRTHLWKHHLPSDYSADGFKSGRVDRTLHEIGNPKASKRQQTEVFIERHSTAGSRNGKGKDMLEAHQEQAG